jgi:tagatose-1,6-bisphosphate aldolase
MKFMDGNCKVTDENLNIIDNGNGADIPKVKYPGYGEKWQEEVVKHTGEKLLIKTDSQQ